MTQVYFSSSITATVNIALNADEDAYIGANSSRASTESDGIRALNGGHTVTVVGHVFGDSSGINLGGDANRISVGSGATVAGRVLAIAIDGSESRITNDGMISADTAISVTDLGGFHLQNNGTIVGADGEAMTIDANGGQIVNNGAIQANDVTAIALNNLSTIMGPMPELVNYGLINGMDFAVTASDPLELTNHGDIFGAISASNGDDVIANHGYIDGSITLEGGNDVIDLRGGRVAGEVYGGAEDDTFYIDDASAEIYGDAGEDTVFSAVTYQIKSDFENITLLGADSIHAIGNSMDNIIRGNSGDNMLDGRGGADTFDGGEGVDTISFASAIGGLGARLNGGAAWGAAAGMVESNVENLIGSSFTDVLIGDAGSNALSGGYGTDSLYGLDGNDLLKGEAGNDLLIGGYGGDALDGGDGIDTASYQNASTAVTARLDGGAGTGEATGDSYSSIENLLGSIRGDVLIGDNGGNGIKGGAGNDNIWGLKGSDEIEGGAGDDMLRGGADADVFAYFSGSGSDDILDFEDNIDTLELNSALWGGASLNAQQVINNFSSFAGGVTTLSFNGGEVIDVMGVTQSQLVGDIEIV